MSEENKSTTTAMPELCPHCGSVRAKGWFAGSQGWLCGTRNVAHEWQPLNIVISTQCAVMHWQQVAGRRGDALRKIAEKSSCDCWHDGRWVGCEPHRSDDPEEWCLTCMAREAMQNHAGGQPQVGTSGCSPSCPDCGSADYWHEWTDAHKILRAVCCGKLYRVLPGNKLEAVPSENAATLARAGEDEFLHDNRAADGRLHPVCSALPRVLQCRGSRWNEWKNHYEPYEYDIILWSICGDYWMVSGCGRGDHPRVEHVEILKQTVLELQSVAGEATASKKGTK